MNSSDELIYKLLLEQYHLSTNRQTMTRLVNRSLLLIGNIVLSFLSFWIYKDKSFILYVATILFFMLIMLIILWMFEDNNLKILIKQIEKVVFRENEQSSKFAADNYIKALYKKYYPERKYMNPVARSIWFIEQIFKSTFSEQHFWLLVVFTNYAFLLRIMLLQK